jgi:hypothetical protein
MSVIGVGAGIRSQKRAADATRSRERSGRRADGEELELDRQPRDCATCDRSVPPSALVFTEEGEVCVQCEAATLEVPQTSVFEGLVPVVFAFPGAAFAGLTLWTVVAGRTTGLFTGKGAAGWMVFLSFAFVCSLVALMLASRRVKDMIRGWGAASVSVGDGIDSAGFVLTAGIFLAVLVGAIAPFL